MKKLLLLTVTLASAALTAVAAPITGSISFTTASGTWAGDTLNVNTISTITSFGSVTVDSRTDSFIPGTSVGQAVTMGTPLDFVPPTSIINPFWSVGDFTFTLL